MDGGLGLAADVKKEVHTGWLPLHGDSSGSRTGLAGQFDELFFHAMREHPVAEQFHVIAAGIEGGKIAHHDLSTWLCDSEEGLQQEDEAAVHEVIEEAG